MKPHTRECTAVLAVALVLAALAVVSLFVGSYPLSVGEILSILTGRLGDGLPARVFWQLRLPRMCMGLISGLSLGVAGGVYQIIFRNPLASPDLTGVASGASLGAACVIVLGVGGSGEIMTGAFAMGMLALGLVLFLVRAARLELYPGRRGGLRPGRGGTHVPEGDGRPRAGTGRPGGVDHGQPGLHHGQ